MLPPPETLDEAAKVLAALDPYLPAKAVTNIKVPPLPAPPLQFDVRSDFSGIRVDVPGFLEQFVPLHARRAEKMAEKEIFLQDLRAVWQIPVYADSLVGEAGHTVTLGQYMLFNVMGRAAQGNNAAAEMIVRWFAYDGATKAETKAESTNTLVVDETTAKMLRDIGITDEHMKKHAIIDITPDGEQ